jgi:predicted peptidase
MKQIPEIRSIVTGIMLYLGGALMLPAEICGQEPATASDSSNYLLEIMEDRMQEGDNGGQLPYRLYVPENYSADHKHPVVFYFHGAGGRGTNNRGHMFLWNVTMNFRFVADPLQQTDPYFVCAPQTATNWTNDTVQAVVLDILDSLSREFSIDPDRIYVSGQSLGGMGTWNFLAEHPEVWAAAIPMCGRGDSAGAADMLPVSIWVWHGAYDRSINVAGSRTMVAALQAAGARMLMTHESGEEDVMNYKYIYSEVEADHDVHKLTSRAPDLVRWMLAQKRGVALHTAEPKQIYVRTYIRQNARANNARVDLLGRQMCLPAHNSAGVTIIEKRANLSVSQRPANTD